MYTDYTEEDEINENYYEENDSNNNNNLDKEKIKRIAFFVIAFVIVVVLIIVIAKGCSKGKSNSPSENNNQVIPSLAISRSNVSIKVNENFELFVDVVNSKVSNPTITWWSEDTNIVAVNDDGIITGISEGTTNVIAVYTEDKKVFSTTCAVTVSKGGVEATSIDITQENVAIPKGRKILLQVSVTPKEATTPKLIFESENSSVASVSEDGYVTGVSTGFTTIRVKSEDGKLNDSVTIRVVESTASTVINPVSIKINSLSSGISVGTSAKINYEVLPANATNKTVTWASSNSSVARVSSDGVVTGVSAGKATIVASTSNGVTGKIEVTVSPGKISVQSVKINDGSNITVTKGGTKVLSYTISPSNATNKSVTFESSNRNVVYIDNKGVMAFLNTGFSNITVKTVDGNKQATIKVYVISSGTTSSTNSGSSSSSSSNMGASCDSQSMVTISHNGADQKPTKATISSVKFEQAYPFKTVANPTISVDAINDCIDTTSGKIYYNIYHGTTANNISTSVNGGSGFVSKGSKIELKNGNGYYKIEIKGYIAGSNIAISKMYYAIVENIIKPTVRLTVSTYLSGSTKMLKILPNVNSSNELKTVRYCLTTSGTAVCSRTASTTTSQMGLIQPNFKKSSNREANIIYNTKYKRVCADAVDIYGNESAVDCKNI